MLLAAIAGALLAWLGYRGRLNERIAQLAAFVRFIAVAALFLLIVDPGFFSKASQSRPVVLLDHSISMMAAGARGAEAATLAATLGDTVPFGLLSPSLPGGNSHLTDLLTTTAATGRPIIVVTDGEIPELIPADVMNSVSIRALPRQAGPDIAITNVRGPERLSGGDTLTLDIEASRTADAPDSASVEVRDGGTVLLRGKLAFKRTTHTRTTLSGRLPAATRGERWLEVALVTNKDSEPGDDLRWVRIVVTPTPGIIVLSSTPDWDGRTLYRTLKEIADAPVSGYVQLQTGRWYRMSDLHTVTTAEVTTAARAADLLAVRGDAAPWKSFGRARLFWQPTEDEGDWFVSGKANSPLGGAFVGTADDSLPPAISAHAIEAMTGTSWVGATARRSRRGAEVPIIGGSDGPNGRTEIIGVDGLYRWSNRGGASGQVWRSMIAASVSWLLGARQTDSAVAKPVAAVTQRGRPVAFRWIAPTAPSIQAIQIEGPKGQQMDSLRFDGAGEATLALDVGRYHYTLERGGTGSFAVEPFSDELVPSPVTLTDREATGLPSSPRRSWRELWWLFAITVTAFGVEWMLRRRMGAL